MSEQTPPQFSLEQHEQMFGFITEARATHNAPTDKSDNLEVLKSVPGIDPVLAVIDGHPEDIPQDGWVVNSHIAPGYGGVINLYRYTDGALVPSSASDTREKYGEARVHFGLTGNYGSHTVAYENPEFPQKSVEPYSRMSGASYTGHSFGQTEVIDLDNGGRLLDEKDPMIVGGRGGNFFSMDYEDIDRRSNSRELDINRVTADPEQLRQILANLGFSMGMSQQGIDTLVTTVDQKVNPVA
jgi:hypothetical protein